MEIVIKVKTDDGKVFEFTLDEAMELKSKLVKMIDGCRKTDPDEENRMIFG
jgi:hypothetical protein